MYKIFRLSLVTAVWQKSIIIVLLLLAVGPFVFQSMTNYAVDPAVIDPARAQAAWQLAWGAACLWLVYQAAKMGGEHVSSRLGEYFLSNGVSKSSQMCGMWAATMVFALCIVAVPVLVCLLAITPEPEVAWRHWVMLNVQHAMLFILVVGAMNLVVLSLSSRFGSLVGYSGGLFLYLAGFYLVLAVEKLVLSKDVFGLDVLYVCLPHFYLADLTHRMVHQQGALTSHEFFSVFEYLAGWSMLLSVLGYVIFTPKKR